MTRSDIAKSEMAYPHQATRLVPEVLQPFIGQVAVSPAIRQRLGLPLGSTLSDIGSDELELLDDRDLELLAHRTQQAIRQAYSRLRGADVTVHVSTVPVEIARQRLSRRAFNVAMRAELIQLPCIAEFALSDMAKAEGMGAATLLEVLSLLEASTSSSSPHSPEDSPPRTPSSAVARSASVLGRRRWARGVRSNDIRLRPILLDLADPEKSVKELSEALLSAEYSPGEARQMAGRIKKLIAAGDSLRRLTVEQEVGQLIDAVVQRSPAGRVALRHRLGVADGRVATLEASGKAARITRERVRQIEKSFLEEMRSSPPWTPALDRATAEVAKQLPGSIADIERSLVEAGATERISLLTLNGLEELLGEKAGRAEVDEQLGLAFREDLPLREIDAVARQLVSHWGATMVDELVATLKERNGTDVDITAASGLIEALPDFEWLDDKRLWFWIKGLSRNRLLNQIEKIMSVAGSIPIGELRAGVGRPHRMQGFRPPREVLARLCVSSGLYRRDGDLIIEGPGLSAWNQVLSPNERVVAEILFEFGPVMRRDDLERIACDERGLNRSSFYMYLSYLPFLARFAPGVFGLRGAPIGAAEVAALIPQRVRTQRLRDHGWTAERKLWMAFELSGSSAQSGVLSTPAELREVAKGEFSLSTEDARPLGTLVIRGPSMWGLSPFFRRSGMEEGDYVLITIDLVTREATITAGTDELLLRHQGGE